MVNVWKLVCAAYCSKSTLYFVILGLIASSDNASSPYLKVLHSPQPFIPRLSIAVHRIPMHWSPQNWSQTFLHSNHIYLRQLLQFCWAIFSLGVLTQSDPAMSIRGGHAGWTWTWHLDQSYVGAVWTCVTMGHHGRRALQNSRGLSARPAGGHRCRTSGLRTQDIWTGWTSLQLGWNGLLYSAAFQIVFWRYNLVFF